LSCRNGYPKANPQRQGQKWPFLFSFWFFLESA
jgi:hypothetical protein